MAQDKKSFIAYSDWKDTFDALSDDKAGILIKHIFSYVNDENPITDDLIIKAVFPNIKNTLKRDLKKWDKQYKQRVDAGKRSAEIRKRNATVVNGRSVSSTVSVSDSVNVSVSDNVILKEKEKEKLIGLYGLDGFEWMVDKLSNYKLASGKKYKSDYGAINSWVVKEFKKEKNPSKKETATDNLHQALQS